MAFWVVILPTNQAFNNVALVHNLTKTNLVHFMIHSVDSHVQLQICRHCLEECFIVNSFNSGHELPPFKINILIGLGRRMATTKKQKGMAKETSITNFRHYNSSKKEGTRDQLLTDHLHLGFPSQGEIPGNQSNSLFF